MPVVGSPEDLALSGWDDAPDDGPVFALGDVAAEAVDVRFAASGSGLLVAPDGDRLWRRSLWPVRDALFDLPPAEGGDVLVVAREADHIVAELDRHGTRAVHAPRLTLEDLEAAAVVVLLEAPGRLPGHAACVLAARRVLVADQTGPTFGLQSGVEFLGVRNADEAVERAHLSRRYPHATASLRVMGARAAREHRASLVYPRAAADLAAAGG